MDNGQLHGLRVPSDNLHLLHGFSADDINLTIRATSENILNCKYIFALFGSASGLHCNCVNPKAIFLSKRQMPDEIRALGWDWEEGPAFSKLLGLHIGDNISHEAMINQLHHILEDRLTKSRGKPTSLIERISD